MISSFAMLVSTGAAQAEHFHGGGGSRGGGGFHSSGGFHGGGGGGWHSGGGGVTVRGGGEWRGGGGWHGGGGEWRGGGGEWRGGAGWHGPVRYYGGGGYYPRRYYDYRYRPELIVENYGYRDGYIWVRGSWQWNGVEWIWYPGHYQPAY
jgi:hypothetical protein